MSHGKRKTKIKQYRPEQRGSEIALLMIVLSVIALLTMYWNIK
jgi:hypothetical protein